MSLLSVLKISYQAGDKPLFENLSFSIQAGDRVGLVGHNGCGKSTLLALLMASYNDTNNPCPDDGRIQFQRGLRLGQVEQFAPKALLPLSMHEALAQSLPADARHLRTHEVTQQLTALGLKEALHHKPLATLSGGQQNLVLFARAAIQRAELLLLDEPGNHVDVLAMSALRSYLSKPNAPAILMISHDRDLLDTATDKTLWLRDQRAYHFDLPYSQAKAALAAQDEAAAKKRASEQKKIDQLTASAKRIANWGKVYDNEDFARKAKSMEKRVDKLKSQQTEVTQGTGLSLSIDVEALQAKQLFTMEAADIKTPQAKPLFSVEHLILKPGDRIALLGTNGSGKSTYINHLISAWRTNQDQQTTIRFNPRVTIGYFDQELAEISGHACLFDWMRRHTSVDADIIKKQLIHWGFPYNMHQQPITHLSGGQRARLLLLRFQLDQPNLLIMDEPTNHLDLEGKEMLERDLRQQNTSLLFTSHDRRFIEQVATRYWWIYQGKLIEINTLDEFYNSLQDTLATTHSRKPSFGSRSSKNKDTTHQNLEQHPPTTEIEILELICHLEKLLTEDLARKPKFQKPKRQAHWRAEIKAWTAKLD